MNAPTAANNFTSPPPIARRANSGTDTTRARPNPPTPCRSDSTPSGALSMRAAASPVTVIELGIRFTEASHQAAAQTSRTSSTLAAACVTPTCSGQARCCGPKVGVRLAENRLDRDTHALNENDNADHDKPEQ